MAEPRKRTFLVPVDNTRAAKQAFKYAVSLSSERDDLVLYHGEEQDVQMYGPGGMIVVKPDPLAKQNSHLLESQFMKDCTNANRNCRWIKKSSVGTFSVSDEVCKLAREVNVDGIVVGNRGLGPITEIVLGSVSRNILSCAHCPVTVVKVSEGVKPVQSQTKVEK
eukprot:TRINITY_DN11453_c0_g1_i2.p1 TRINITY_DN11453_c0_g1~~TRINITY_DN11453_c0_g1_i2.p1  ORF type:complete len:165 (+),score=35.84 TRINITY_DN11453_c0_g1_i2:72-566(+)